MRGEHSVKVQRRDDQETFGHRTRIKGDMRTTQINHQGILWELNHVYQSNV